MANQSILEKVKHCLALSKSSNENEAAIALRQAHNLMQKHNLTKTDVLASEVEWKQAKANCTGTPTAWETRLVNIIGKVFQCEVLLSTDWKGRKSWEFIGVNPAPEIASYAMTVVLRQLVSNRREFMAELKRLPPAMNKNKELTRSRKIELADAYCEAFVFQCQSKVEGLLNQPKDERVQAYMYKHHSDLESAGSINRLPDDLQKIDLAGSWALAKGAKDGEKVSIHTGMTGEQTTAIEHV